MCHRAQKAEAAKSQATSQALAQLISTNTYLLSLPPSAFKNDALQATQSAMLATIQSIGVSPVLPSVSAPAPAARAVPGLVDDVCSVCQDTITMRQSSTRTPCDHWFHHNCIARWIRSRPTPTCPVCRQSLSDEFVEILDDFGNEVANREVLDGDNA